MRSVRPRPGDFNEYYGRYTQLVPDGDVVQTLAVQWLATRDVLVHAVGDLETFRYEPGKWSLVESVAHVVDTERVFTQRILWIARRAEVELPSMEQDDWARLANAEARPLAKHLAEWQAVRGGLVALLDGLAPDAWSRAGMAAGGRVTVRALAWIIAGHELHHRRLWAEVYGVGPSQAMPPGG